MRLLQSSKQEMTMTLLINQSTKSLILILALYLANAINILCQIHHRQTKCHVQATSMGKCILSSKWSTWVLRWGPCDLRKDSRQGCWGLGRFAGRKREYSPITPAPFSKAVREDESERGLPTIILPWFVGQ